MAQRRTAMWQEPAWHEISREEPEVWGVQTLYTDAVLLRVVARTVPLRQWEVQRELMERLKSALDATGVADGSGVVSATEASSGAVVPAGAQPLADPSSPPGAQPLAYPPRPAPAPPSPATAQHTLGTTSF